MAIELPNGEEVLGLSQYNRCYTSVFHTLPFDEEHIIPRMAADKHPRLFKNLLPKYENKSHVCKNCHREIDNGPVGKLVTFRNYGPVGLLNYIGVMYPIPEDAEFRDIFVLQRKILFMDVRDNINAIKLSSPARGLSTLHEAVLRTVEMHIGWWDVGRLVAPQFERVARDPERFQDTLALQAATV